MSGLHYATKKGYVDVVNVLIQKGVDVNAVDNDYKTALYWAAQRGHVDVVKLLLQNGADVNAVGEYYKKTALRIAAEQGHNSVVKMLIRNGAKHNYDDILRMSKHLRSLHRQGDRDCRVFTQAEEKFFYNFALVLAIKYPWLGERVFYSVFHFMSHDGCFMSRIFRIVGRRSKKKKRCLIS